MSVHRRNTAPVVRKSRIGEQGTDFAYWQTRPFVERLAALEEIRREHHAAEGYAEQRIQRVCRIFKLPITE